MPAQLRIVALGTSLDLVMPGRAPAAFVDAVAHAWSRCLTGNTVSPRSPTDALQPATQLTVTGPTDDTDEAVRAALQRLSQDVTRHLIVAQSGRLLMFHAGAVCHPETGGSVVFVAPSGTGKTTLAGLLGRRFGYLTDETVGIDPASGSVLPYPKPLSISPDGRRAKVETSPDDLGLVVGHPDPDLRVQTRPSSTQCSGQIPTRGASDSGLKWGLPRLSLPEVGITVISAVERRIDVA